jgi:hypothetical protein
VWHIYATPDNPATCPVLALACYIFANPGLTEQSYESAVAGEEAEGDVGQSAGCLFPGGNQYDRFMDCLRWVVENNFDVFLALGTSLGDLGSHSARKGASSYASAGSTVCPPMVSICLRAMWSMGSVKERYLQYEKAGDQYLDRVVSGLDINSIAFATSPPFFNTADQGERDQIWSLVKDYMVGEGGRTAKT